MADEVEKHVDESDGLTRLMHDSSMQNAHANTVSYVNTVPLMPKRTPARPADELAGGDVEGQVRERV